MGEVGVDGPLGCVGFVGGCEEGGVRVAGLELCGRETGGGG